MPKVSIIIPVYNAGKYISETVNSIQRQKFLDWELFLVDDCSSDNTPIVCQELAACDKRITYIRLNKNCGPAIARNIAIDKSTGEYLSFIDSDDLIEPNYLSCLVSTADNSVADVIWCNYFEDFEHKSLRRSHQLPSNVIFGKEAVSLFFQETIGLGSLWTKLYRRSFIEKHNCRLNLKRVHGEDWEFNMDVFRHGAKVLPIQDYLYHYIRQNANSVISSYRPFDYDTYVYSFELKEQLADEFKVSYDKRKMNGNHIYMVIALLLCLVKSNYPEKRNEFSRIAQDKHLQEIISSKNYDVKMLPLRYKLCFFVLKFNSVRFAYHIFKKLK